MALRDAEAAERGRPEAELRPRAEARSGGGGAARDRLARRGRRGARGSGRRARRRDVPRRRRRGRGARRRRRGGGRASRARRISESARRIHDWLAHSRASRPLEASRIACSSRLGDRGSMSRHSTLSDAELVRHCREGDAEAWNELVERYSRYVYAIAVQGLPPLGRGRRGRLPGRLHPRLHASRHAARRVGAAAVDRAAHPAPVSRRCWRARAASSRPTRC